MSKNKADVYCWTTSDAPWTEGRVLDSPGPKIWVVLWICVFDFVRVVSRSQAGAVGQFWRGMLAADGGLLERRPFPETSARYSGTQPAEHHGPAVQLQLGAEEQQPRGLKLKTLHTN